MALKWNATMASTGRMMAQFASAALARMRRAVSAKILLGERLLNVDALRVQERVRHGAADHQRVDLGDQVLQQLELGRDLRAADDGDDRARRRFQRLAERFELGLHGAARIGRKLVRETFGRGVRAVRGRESVVDDRCRRALRASRRRPGRSSLLPCGSACSRAGEFRHSSSRRRPSRRLRRRNRPRSRRAASERVRPPPRRA